MFPDYLFLMTDVTHIQDFQKKCIYACEAAAVLVQNWGKLAPCPNQQQQTLFLEISYIPLLSMTLHYHRLYQISSLEANLSLQDMKQLCQ